MTAAEPPVLVTALQGLMDRFRGQERFAVFDADNTIWHGDLEESLLAYLESLGVLSAAKLPLAQRPVPLTEGETLYEYYFRLCKLHHDVSYLWVAQVFAGMSVSELCAHVDALFALEAPIPSAMGAVPPPRIYPAQRRLLHALREAFIRPYVVTACLEELARHVLCHPTHGIELPPRDVIGLSLGLAHPETGELTTTAWSMEATGRAPGDLDGRVLTAHLAGPTTWYRGKCVAMERYISQSESPVLMAGDSPSDRELLFRVDVSAGGLRLFNAHSTEAKHAMQREAQKRAAASCPANAGAGWLYTSPEQLFGESELAR